MFDTHLAAEESIYDRVGDGLVLFAFSVLRKVLLLSIFVVVVRVVCTRSSYIHVFPVVSLLRTRCFVCYCRKFCTRAMQDQKQANAMGLCL